MFTKLRTRLALVIAPWLAPSVGTITFTKLPPTGLYYYVNSSSDTSGTSYTTWAAN